MFKLTIETDNEAFDRHPKHELRRILADVSVKLADRTEGAILDINGNKVGSWSLTERGRS